MIYLNIIGERWRWNSLWIEIATVRGAKEKKSYSSGVLSGAAVADSWLSRPGMRGSDGGVAARNRRQDCHPVVRLGDRRERSSVKPLIMPKQYTVGAPVSVPDPHCSGLVPSKFGASNEFQWNSCHPTVLSKRPDTWKLFRKRSRRWNV